VKESAILHYARSHCFPWYCLLVAIFWELCRTFEGWSEWLEATVGSITTVCLSAIVWNCAKHLGEDQNNWG
jgi:hypothetical protein